MRGIFFSLRATHETRDRRRALLLLVPANGRDARVSAFYDDENTNDDDDGETTTLLFWVVVVVVVEQQNRRRRHPRLDFDDSKNVVGGWWCIIAEAQVRRFVGERADENETVEARAARAVARRVFASVVQNVKAETRADSSVVFVFVFFLLATDWWELRLEERKLGETSSSSKQ